MEGEESEKATGCLACWDKFDDNWIRPYLIYKFDRLKERPEFEFEDMLEEYKIIEEELNETNLPGDKSISRIIVNNQDGTMKVVPSVLATYLSRRIPSANIENSMNQRKGSALGAAHAKSMRIGT